MQTASIATPVTAGAVAAPPPRGAAQPVAGWTFGRDDDRNFDAWPDNWQRMTGRGYPYYLPIAIVPHRDHMALAARRADAAALGMWRKLKRTLADAPRWIPGVPAALTASAPAVERLLSSLPPSLNDLLVDHYLRIDLDGGAAMLQSAPLPVSDLYRYVLRLRIRTGGLRWNQAWAEVAFLDAEGRMLASLPTAAVSGESDWQTLHTPAATPPADSAAAVVRLRLEPRGTRQDIRGWAGFDSLHLERFPQLTLRGSQPTGIYRAGERPTVTAEVLGWNDPHATLRFELTGVDGQVLASNDVAVQAQPDGPQQAAFGATVRWQLPPLMPGFYRIRTGLQTSRPEPLAATLTMAVVDDSLPAPGGPFGWTLPDGPAALPLDDLPDWLHACRVGWLKYPCWTAPDDPEGAERLAKLFLQVQQRGIETVGMLDQPPVPADDPAQRAGQALPVAQVFRDPALWRPQLESVTTRLTGHIRCWQVGRDRDASLIGWPQLADTVRQVREGLQGYGQPIAVAVSWPWTEPQPADAERTWQAVCLGEAAPLTAEELDTYLQGIAGAASETWLVLDPLPADQYDLDTRIRDLVLRMATVRRHDVQAAFVSRPLDPRTGLLKPDAAPAEMLLPWRTAAALLGNARPIGSLQLPGGSDNLLFSDGQQTMMLAWSTSPTTETLFLGDAVQQIDVWGRRSAVPTVRAGGVAQQTIHLGPVPVFFLGLDPLITALRTSVQLETETIDSLLGRRQAITLRFTNPDRDTLRGQLQLRPMDDWDVARTPQQWDVPAGQTARQSLDVILQPNATTGRRRLALDFTLHQDPPRRFTVYRDLDVGPVGLQVELTSRLLDDGQLVVRLEMVNDTARRQEYDCSLFAAGRQFQRQPVSVASGDRVVRQFSWPDGHSLVGTTLFLRASERNGQRVLNYTLPVRR